MFSASRYIHSCESAESSQFKVTTPTELRTYRFQISFHGDVKQLQTTVKSRSGHSVVLRTSQYTWWLLRIGTTQVQLEMRYKTLSWFHSSGACRSVWIILLLWFRMNCCLGVLFCVWCHGSMWADLRSTSCGFTTSHPHWPWTDTEPGGHHVPSVRTWRNQKNHYDLQPALTRELSHTLNMDYKWRAAVWNWSSPNRTNEMVLIRKLKRVFTQQETAASTWGSSADLLLLLLLGQSSAPPHF